MSSLVVKGEWKNKQMSYNTARKTLVEFASQDLDAEKLFIYKFDSEVFFKNRKALKTIASLMKDPSVKKKTSQTLTLDNLQTMGMDIDMYNDKLKSGEIKSFAHYFRTDAGNSLLHLAVCCWDKYMVEHLLRTRHDFNCKNNYGETPLDIAVRQGFEDVRRSLSKHIAQESVEDNKNNRKPKHPKEKNQDEYPHSHGNCQMTSLTSAQKESLNEIKACGRVGTNNIVQISSSMYELHLSKSWGANKTNVKFLAVVYDFVTSSWDKDTSCKPICVGNYITDINTASMCVVLCAAIFARYGLNFAGFTHDVRDENAFVCVDVTKQHAIIFKMKLKTANDKLISGITLKEKINERFLNIQHADMRFRLKDTKEEFLYVVIIRGGVIRAHYSNNPNKKILKKEYLTCAFCNKKAELKQCSRCRSVSYCSDDCARQNWNIHKKVCCPPLPKNVSISLNSYEDSYGEPVFSWENYEFNKEVKCNMSMNALAYFHKITGDTIILIEAKDYCKKKKNKVEKCF